MSAEICSLSKINLSKPSQKEDFLILFPKGPIVIMLNIYYLYIKHPKCRRIMGRPESLKIIGCKWGLIRGTKVKYRASGAKE